MTMKVLAVVTIGLALMGAQAAEGDGKADALWQLPPGRLALDAKKHGPQVPPDALPATLDAFTISAWVKPSAFDRYNEIFRIESDEGRVLFSFQENGRILSLGLHGKGYVECDGPIDPAKAADGKWHYAVASLGKGAPALSAGCFFAFGNVLQPALVKPIGQQFPQGEFLCLALAVEADDLHLRGKLHHHLAAGAAGHAVVLRPSRNGDAHEIPVPLADRLDNGGALGADGAAVGGVFNVAPGKHGAVAAFQRGPHREMGIGDVGHVQHVDGLLAKLFFRHGYHSFLFSYCTPLRPVRQPSSACPVYSW